MGGPLWVILIFLAGLRNGGMEAVGDSARFFGGGVGFAGVDFAFEGPARLTSTLAGRLLRPLAIAFVDAGVDDDAPVFAGSDMRLEAGWAGLLPLPLGSGFVLDAAALAAASR
jgi:hypothetical protein